MKLLKLKNNAFTLVEVTLALGGTLAIIAFLMAQVFMQGAIINSIRQSNFIVREVPLVTQKMQSLLLDSNIMAVGNFTPPGLSNNLIPQAYSLTSNTAPVNSVSRNMLGNAIFFSKPTDPSSLPGVLGINRRNWTIYALPFTDHRGVRKFYLMVSRSQFNPEVGWKLTPHAFDNIEFEQGSGNTVRVTFTITDFMSGRPLTANAVLSLR